MTHALAILAAGEGGNGFWIPHDVNEVFVGSAAFFIVIGLLYWKAGPAIKAAMAKRGDDIAADLDEAAQAKADAEGERDAIATQLADRETEVARIHADAEATAAKVEADLIAKGEAEAKAIRLRGGSDVEVARRQARADLQAELARLSLGAAEAVVAESLDDSTQADLIDQYIAQLGARS
ncbi:MAG: F0F1 ATP synthase subunit B [Microthrixaceae bacterium]